MGEGVVEAIGVVLYISGAAAWVLFEHFKERQAQERAGVVAAWRRAAEGAGLTGVRWSSSRLGEESHLEGRSGALTVRFEACGKGMKGTRVVIGGARHGDKALTLRREDFVTSALSASHCSAPPLRSTWCA